MFDIVISIVLFNNNLSDIQSLLSELLEIKASKKIVIINNSSKYNLSTKNFDKDTFDYIVNSQNLGFGKAHNIALKKYIDQTRFFLIINPDVFIKSDDIQKILTFLYSRGDIGILLPNIIHELENNNHYHLASGCHLIPTPFDLFLKRFFPIFFRKKIDRYNLYSMDKSKIQLAPNLSGCCLFVSSLSLKSVGYFDERFFLYMEDVDLVRRVAEKFKTVYYPFAKAIHKRNSLSYKKIKFLLIHIKSAIKYFNKWGWFYDPKRALINNNTLKSLNKEEF